MYVAIGTTFGNGGIASARASEVRAGVQRIKTLATTFTAVYGPGAATSLKSIVDVMVKRYEDQINTSIQNGKTWTGRYSFAPNGSKSAWDLIRTGIRSAQKYIYLEDQYLTSRFVAAELVKRL